jgi:hypothetical protein
MLVQRAIDRQSTYAAVEDADRKILIQGLVRTACGSGRAILSTDRPCCQLRKQLVTIHDPPLIKLRQLVTLAVDYIINRPLHTALIPQIPPRSVPPA